VAAGQLELTGGA
jgi:hypothetical protein